MHFILILIFIYWINFKQKEKLNKKDLVVTKSLSFEKDANVVTETKNIAEEVVQEESEQEEWVIEHEYEPIEEIDEYDCLLDSNEDEVIELENITVKAQDSNSKKVFSKEDMRKAIIFSEILKRPKLQK